MTKLSINKCFQLRKPVGNKWTQLLKPVGIFQNWGVCKQAFSFLLHHALLRHVFALSLRFFFCGQNAENSWEWECLQCRLLTKPMLDAHFHLDVYHPLSLLQPSSTFTIACYYHHQLSLLPYSVVSSFTITAQYHHKSATITIVSTSLHHPRSWSLVTVIVHCYCYFITGVLACIMNKSPQKEVLFSFLYTA